MSGCILHLASSHSPVFLINSCLDLFSAPRRNEDPFSRSYGVSLPNSLTMNLPTPQYVLPGYLCRFAVRVPSKLTLSGFSREYDYPHCHRPPKGTAYFQVRLCGWICLPASLPTPFNAPVRRRAEVPLLRHHIAPEGSHGILTVSASAFAIRLRLRTRLTPG